MKGQVVLIKISYVEVLTPTTEQCDYIWKQSKCSSGYNIIIRMTPNPTAFFVGGGFLFFISPGWPQTNYVDKTLTPDHSASSQVLGLQIYDCDS